MTKLKERLAGLEWVERFFAPLEKLAPEELDIQVRITLEARDAMVRETSDSAWTLGMSFSHIEQEYTGRGILSKKAKEALQGSYNRLFPIFLIARMERSIRTLKTPFTEDQLRNRFGSIDPGLFHTAFVGDIVTSIVRSSSSRASDGALLYEYCEEFDRDTAGAI